MEEALTLNRLPLLTAQEVDELSALSLAVETSPAGLEAIPTTPVTDEGPMVLHGISMVTCMGGGCMDKNRCEAARVCLYPNRPR